jgi:hypothetical protein
MRKVRQRIQVTEEWIFHYPRSIGAPMQTIGGELIASATMPCIFWRGLDIPWLNEGDTWIHGSQRFSYESPLTSGMNLDCELSLMKTETKEGRQGKLTLYTHTLVCCNGNDLIITAETVLIQVGERHEHTDHG